MFVLTENEVDFMVSQNAIPSKQHLGGSLPPSFYRARCIFQRLDTLEIKQIQNQLKSDEKFNTIFSAIEETRTPKKQNIFYDGQIFDAYLFVSNIIKSAKISIKLIRLLAKLNISTIHTSIKIN